MIDVWPFLQKTTFPAIKRGELTTLQVNMGYLCNQQCKHCHVDAGPKRTELMSLETVNEVLQAVERLSVSVLDLTGGAPEMNPHFKYMVTSARKLGVNVIDRCNLSILNEPGYEGLAEFLAEHGVEVVASLPCYLEENVDMQRGNGIFKRSIQGLQQLNRLGYGKEGSDLKLNLVYNPQGAALPPPQPSLEDAYKQMLGEQYDVAFNQLFTITNVPVKRFGSTLISKGEFDDYMKLLKDNYERKNTESVMCRSLISIDWQGYIYDCDFNQMLKLKSGLSGGQPLHISKLDSERVVGKPIAVAEHCYACTAGQGSSCGGALSD